MPHIDPENEEIIRFDGTYLIHKTKKKKEKEKMRRKKEESASFNSSKLPSIVQSKRAEMIAGNGGGAKQIRPTLHSTGMGT